jgi:hypothetical protein
MLKVREYCTKKEQVKMTTLLKIDYRIQKVYKIMEASLEKTFKLTWYEVSQEPT